MWMMANFGGKWNEIYVSTRRIWGVRREVHIGRTGLLEVMSLDSFTMMRTIRLCRLDGMKIVTRTVIPDILPETLQPQLKGMQH